MRKRNREINVFNLSMLDVISSAMAAFLIIMVVLLPYYDRMPMEYVAELKEKLAAAISRAEGAEQEAELAHAEAQAAREEAAKAKARAEELEKKDLDLMIAIDTTGSMGSEIDSLKKDIKGLVRVLDTLSKRLRVGVIAYRDAPEYVTRPFSLTPTTGSGMSRLDAFVDALEANSSPRDNTIEERVDAGLQDAVNQPWDANAEGIIVVIGDQRAHPDRVQRAYDLAAQFAARSERYRVSTITPARAGSQAHVVDFYRRLADYGGGAYITGATELLSSIIVSIYK